MTKKEKQIPLFPILFVNFIGTLGFSVVLPFLVFLVTKFGGNSLAYGIMGASYPLFQLIGAPILGRWSDIYGRKKILLLSEAGTLLGWMIFMAAFFLPMKKLIEFSSDYFGVLIVSLPLIAIFLARAVDGITGGNISVANAYVSDITDEKNRSRNFGKLSVSANLGFIAGPALAGLLGSTRYAEMLPVVTTLLISLICVLAIQFFLPDSKPAAYETDINRERVKKILGAEHKECYNIEGEKKIKLKTILKNRGIAFTLILYFLIFLGFNVFYTVFPVHVVQKLKWSISEVGIYYSVLSLTLVLVEGPVLSFVSKKVSDIVLIITGNLILTVCFILMMSPNTVIIYSAIIFFSLGNGLMWPSFLSYLSKVAGEKYQGTVQGFASSAGSLASIIGLIAGGIIYSFLGAYSFLFASTLIFLVFLLSFYLLKFKKESTVSNKLQIQNQ